MQRILLFGEACSSFSSQIARGLFGRFPNGSLPNLLHCLTPPRFHQDKILHFVIPDSYSTTHWNVQSLNYTYTPSMETRLVVSYQKRSLTLKICPKVNSSLSFRFFSVSLSPLHFPPFFISITLFFPASLTRSLEIYYSMFHSQLNKDKHFGPIQYWHKALIFNISKLMETAASN